MRDSRATCHSAEAGGAVFIKACACCLTPAAIASMTRSGKLDGNRARTSFYLTPRDYVIGVGCMLGKPPVEFSLLGFCRVRYCISLDNVVPKRFD
jgi:hypothetical protein